MAPFLDNIWRPAPSFFEPNIWKVKSFKGLKLGNMIFILSNPSTDPAESEIQPNNTFNEHQHSSKEEENIQYFTNISQKKTYNISQIFLRRKHISQIFFFKNISSFHRFESIKIQWGFKDEYILSLIFYTFGFGIFWNILSLSHLWFWNFLLSAVSRFYSNSIIYSLRGAWIVKSQNIKGQCCHVSLSLHMMHLFHVNANADSNMIANGASVHCRWKCKYKYKFECNCKLGICSI